MNAKEIQDDIIKTIIKPRFKENRFKVSGLTLLKKEVDFVKVFNIQSSSWNTADEVKFTFNLGFFLPDTYEFWLGQPVPQNIKEYHCVFNLRPGPILKSGTNDYWYSINESRNLEELKNLIRAHVKTYYIPFFNKYNLITDLINLGEIDSTYYNMLTPHLALILAKKGNHELAEELISNYLKNGEYPDNWIKKLESEAKKVNLKIKDYNR